MIVATRTFRSIVSADRRQKAEISFQLNAKGIRVGWADKFIECQRFLSDPEIGLIIWSPSSLLGHHSFWPVDMIDILITTYSIIEKLKDSQLSLKSWPSLLVPP